MPTILRPVFKGPGLRLTRRVLKNVHCVAPKINPKKYRRVLDSFFTLATINLCVSFAIVAYQKLMRFFSACLADCVADNLSGIAVEAVGDFVFDVALHFEDAFTWLSAQCFVF